MKKSLIALAVLGSFAGASFASSSATLYGMLDVGYGVSNAGKYEGAAGREGKFQQWGNSNSTSRWGLKGSEDLGNGVKVYFNLESKIDPENGSYGKKMFDRAALVGISSKFGSLQAGRQTTVMNNVLGQFSVSGDPNLTSALGNAGVSAISQRNGGDGYSRIDSALAYISPEFYGFNFQGALVLKNDSVFGPDSKNLYTVGLQYKWRGLTVAGAFESKPVDGVSSSWGLGAKYDFGSFLISGGYTDNHIKEDGKGFYLGVSVPINAFTVGAQIAYNTKAIDGQKEVGDWGWAPNDPNNVWAGFSPAYLTRDEDNKIKPLAWELFAQYSMSKRTTLYAQYGGMNNKGKQYNASERKYSASFGMMHKF